MPVRAGKLALGMTLVATLASPACAATDPTTRLVSCGEGSCLLIRGHRADPASTVTVNGHAVATDGARIWRASLPVDTVREWSAPYARSVMVSVVDGKAPENAATEVDLPIGLLGHAETLAMLVIAAK